MELTADRSEGGGEADGLARRYATALFDLAVERRQLPQVEEDGRRLRTAVAASRQTCATCLAIRFSVARTPRVR